MSNVNTILTDSTTWCSTSKSFSATANTTFGRSPSTRSMNWSSTIEPRRSAAPSRSFWRTCQRRGDCTRPRTTSRPRTRTSWLWGGVTLFAWPTPAMPIGGWPRTSRAASVESCLVSIWRLSTDAVWWFWLCGRAAKATVNLDFIWRCRK